MAKEKWKRRESKLDRRKGGMQVVGRSIFTLQQIQKKKADEIKNKKPKKK
jgi:hypothetical protein